MAGSPSLSYRCGVTSPRLAVAVLIAVLAAPGGSVSAAEPPFLEPPRLTWDGPKAPWLARRRGDPKLLEPTGHGLRDISRWPAEPPTPEDISVEALAKALKTACTAWMPPSRPGRYAGWILERSRHFGVDPLIVAGLIISQSGCDPRYATEAGVGLAGLYSKMHLSNLKDRRYRYQVFADGAWQSRQVDLTEHLFYDRALAGADGAIYFAAGLLKVATDQCPHNDGAFESVPHRHPVSHVIWGDRVRGAGAEDHVLLARRQLIEHLTGQRAPLTGDFRGAALVSPVDGAPRPLSSGWGDERDGGKRTHKGVDFHSTQGEPVRAVADGTVTFSGFGWRGGGASNVAPAKLAERIEGGGLGKAGVYIKIEHAGDLMSVYMHLNDTAVALGETVRAGQLIGHVGRTGVKASPAHLHFELREAGEHTDPLPHLGPLVFEPEATWQGWRIAYELERQARRGGQ